MNEYISRYKVYIVTICLVMNNVYFTIYIRLLVINIISPRLICAYWCPLYRDDMNSSTNS